MDNDISNEFAVSMQLLALSIKFKTSQWNQKRLSRARRTHPSIFLCLPVILSSCTLVTLAMTSGSPTAAGRPQIPSYRSQITECRYSGKPDVSVVLASINHVFREEFLSNLKNCLDPRGFRWAAMI